MKILFIENEPEVILEASKLLSDGGETCEVCGFSDCESALSLFQPDILVLDLMAGIDPGDVSAGNAAYGSICEKRFRPIIVYSANPELFSIEHPLIYRVKKGRGSPAEVKRAVEGFTPCITSINTVKDTMDDILQKTLREVIPYFWENGTAPLIPVEDLAKRRIAATLDMQSCGRQKIAPWEQYIVPPLGEFLLSGDILLECGADKYNPASYRLVLTPSCDMVLHPGTGDSAPKAKVSEVLCAKCESPDIFLKQAFIGVKDNESSKMNALQSLLSQGYYKEFIPISGLDRFFPPMVANLKSLELIKYENIKNDESGVFRRFVSVDSPFREQMTWAFLHTGCRPGAPDRDTETWAKQYIISKPATETK